MAYLSSVLDITGISKGLVEQLVSLASLFVGVWAAFRFSTVIAEWLNGFLQLDQKIVNIAAFALTVILAVLLLTLLGKLITKTLKLAALGWANRLLGLVFALLKAALIIGLLIFVLLIFATAVRQVRRASACDTPIAAVADLTAPVPAPLKSKAARRGNGTPPPPFNM